MPTRFRSAAIAVSSVVAASVLGQLATFPNLAPWYAGLLKPAFNPPNWVFGPVWTTLYALMAYAVWRILRLPRGTALRGPALSVFFVHLVLNATWPWMFFGAHSPLLGLVNIVPQLIAILAAGGIFYRIDKWAAWCLLPLALWVAYASALNAAIWQLNT